MTSKGYNGVGLTSYLGRSGVFGQSLQGKRGPVKILTRMMVWSGRQCFEKVNLTDGQV